ncbi:MAG: hypothetical protein ACFFE8_02270 [Candidatus Heimdallarchaeota archaeon]
MVSETKNHENIIKFIHLLDKWRKHYPTDQEIVALTAAGSKKYSREVNRSVKIARDLQIPDNFPLLDRLLPPAETITAALLIVFVVVILSSFWSIFSWADDLLSNPLYVFTTLISVLFTATIRYQHRQKTKEYSEENKTQLREFKHIADDLVNQLLPLAIAGEFEPRSYPFQLNYDDYKGLRLMGRSSGTFKLMFSTPHTILGPSKDAKIMTSFGRLGFYDGLRGFQGGRPAIKMVVSKIAGEYKAYLKRCADWRQTGVDILVRKAGEDDIKQTYLIIDDRDVWTTDLLLEEMDIKTPTKIQKIQNNSKRLNVLENFEKLWQQSQVATELEAISWRAYFKEKAEFERKKKGEI